MVDNLHVALDQSNLGTKINSKGGEQEGQWDCSVHPPNLASTAGVPSQLSTTPLQTMVVIGSSLELGALATTVRQVAVNAECADHHLNFILMDT